MIYRYRLRHPRTGKTWLFQRYENAILYARDHRGEYILEYMQYFQKAIDTGMLDSEGNKIWEPGYLRTSYEYVRTSAVKNPRPVEL